MVRSRRLPEVVDIVDLPVWPCAEVEDVPDRVDEVQRDRGSSALSGIVLAELAVDPEPADAAQAVAVGVEELLVEELPLAFSSCGGLPGRSRW